MSYFSHSIPAHDDTGLEYLIDVYTEQLSSGSTDANARRGELLYDGQQVRHHGKGHYQLPDGMIVTSKHPDAL